MKPRYSILYFETTRRCNLSCPYCSSGSQKPEGSYPADMTTQQIKDRVLNPARKLGTELLDLSGGEFLLRDDALDLLDFANKTGFRIAMATNGLLLDEAQAREIKRIVGDNIIISFGINSFDELNPETRETKDSFVLERIQMLEHLNIRANISITMGQFNKTSFSDTVARIRELHLPFNRIPFVPRNCGRSELMPDKASMRDYFHEVLRNNYNGQVSYTPYFLPQDVYEKVSGQDLNREKIPLNPPVGCWVGAYYAINAEGDVSPCPMFLDQVKGGNVLDTDLKEILFESALFKTITNRDALKGKCGNCRYTHTCGGCRVMAYFHTGDMYAEDPICFIDELSESELSGMEAETVKSFRNYVRMAYFGKIFLPPK